MDIFLLAYCARKSRGAARSAPGAGEAGCAPKGSDRAARGDEPEWPSGSEQAGRKLCGRLLYQGA